MEKIYVYSSVSLDEFPLSNLHAIQLEVELFNRDKSEIEKKKIYQGIFFPPEGLKFEAGELKPFSLSEKADRGLISVPEDQKIEDDKLVPKNPLELLQCGLLTISEYKEKKIQQINSKFDAAMEKILCRYSKTEPLFWPILSTQAKVWIEANLEEKEILKHTLVALTSESMSEEDDDITELANTILTKSGSFEAYNGICKRMKKEWITQVKNNTKTNVTVLYDELESIAIEYPVFEGASNG
ncbi:hypothetical protein A0128_00990 [Leptospira tipperaryensis]|uniref:Uncharacterized protein n=1 Tax=Leptospira tipperaryensis TaxID=2564040 RepID=A0A1D7USP4_9LEPT|nr:hypothetical protein [Leptospira tipperaryensis]AOP32575.1 hypothetical protein A0128_00990 [Leptospira tipperaryensis]